MKKAHQIGNKDTPQLIHHENKASIRLNKYISSSGYCSRREADQFIKDGQVTIDGEVAQVGSQVLEQQVVIVNHFKIEPKKKQIYIALHKPIGIICTTDTKIQGNIIDYLKHEERLFPIGRLDKDTSGLILITNDGDIVNKILRSENEHEKEYIVTTDKRIDNKFIGKIRSGVRIYNPVNNTYQITKPCKAYIENSNVFRLVLEEGLNRQIRRMCTALHYRVVKLIRVRVMNIHLDFMKEGEWRYLTDQELYLLNEKINGSNRVQNQKR